MTSAPSKQRTRLATAGRFSAVAGLLLLGACSLPDWADPGSYFEPSYGPAPQPVARAGNDPLPASQPAPGLAAATENVQRAGEKPVIAVTQESATTPSPATPSTTVAAAGERPEPARPVRTREVAKASTVPPPKPRATATVGQTAPATPVVRRSAASQIAVAQQPAPETVARPAAKAQPKAQPRRSTKQAHADESPTPMIAAMTQGQRPPSFTEDGRVVQRRTDVAANPNLGLDSDRDRPAATSAAAASARAPAAAEAPRPSRTYEEQLQLAGVSTGSAAGSTGSGRVQPGQFPSSVSPVVVQTYQESLSAPRTYAEAVGGTGGGTGSTGTVIIGGNGVTQQGTVLTGAAGGADAVIQFRHGSARLSSNDQAILRRIAAQATQRNARVRIRGHSSSRTGQMPVDTHLLANLRISARRAETVADALARFGVPYERIIVEAKGDNAPVFNEAMPSGEAGNRRAEIYLEN